MEAAEWLFWGAWGIVIYAYVVFPIGLALAARLFGPRAQVLSELGDPELPSVTMVVAAYNEAVQKAGATRLTDVTLSERWWGGYVILGYVFKVEGTAVTNK